MVIRSHFLPCVCLFLGLYINSRIPVRISKPPNSFFSSSISKRRDNHEPTAAATQPERIAGKIFFTSSAPCFHRNKHATSADGRKNNRFISLACPCSIPSTSVSHSISKLPPPTPIPARKPNTVLTVNTTGNDSSINIAPHPKGSVYLKLCEAIWLVFSVLGIRPPHRPMHCPSDMGAHR